MNIGVHQPNYLPWLGYFRKIALSDAFVFFDDVQIEKGGYTNRVKMYIGDAPRWLTQPLEKRGALHSTIREMRFADTGPWRQNHFRSIEQSYGKRPYYGEIEDLLHIIYENDCMRLCEFNVAAICRISERLTLETKFHKSSDLVYARAGRASAKLASICQTLGGGVYNSGLGGRTYNDHDVFKSYSVAVKYDDWALPEYPQGHDFVTGLSVIDVIVNIGLARTRELLMMER